MKDAPRRRRVPQVDKVLRHPLIIEAAKSFNHEVLTRLIRAQLAQLRADLDKPAGDLQAPANSSDTDSLDEEVAAIAQKVVAHAKELRSGGLQRVVNGTGVILNTNLGRAPVPKEAARRVFEVLCGYANLEIDLDSGKRGERGQIIDQLLSLITGCEAALLVNNNAAAVMLSVVALAKDKEVIVSRGELIEIGGSFRLPDVITQAGGILKEVGTTNRTRISDYRNALSKNTGMILRCHRSNFEITGYTEEADLAELVSLSEECGIALVEDLGSGALFDLRTVGLKHEPTVTEVIEKGAGLVLFSADKLLGGSQAGIIIGKRELVSRLRKNPIYRALRADKLSIALVEQVLSSYLTAAPEQEIPTIKMAGISAETLKERALEVTSLAQKRFGGLTLEVVPVQSTFGGGTLPGSVLPSYGLSIAASQTQGVTRLPADKLAARLRSCNPPVVALVSGDRVIVDLRTVGDDEQQFLLDALGELDATVLSG